MKSLKQIDRRKNVRLALFLRLTLVAWSASSVLAGPLIEVDPPWVWGEEPIQCGGQIDYTFTVTNTGDEPLVVSQIGVFEYSDGPSPWLSTSESSLTVLPGAENAVQFSVTVDASAYDVATIMHGHVWLLSNATNTDSFTMGVGQEVDCATQTVQWDTIRSNSEMYDPYGIPEGECTGLALSDGGAMGLPGWNTAHLGYVGSGHECGTREEDGIYLRTGSPFLLIDDGSSVSLTTSHDQSGLTEDHHWRQAAGSPACQAALS